ncbi:MAG TPA: 2-phospho-L-lactate guanylyltransferase [Candidatus Tectomicrobia bacterium]
MTYAVIPAKDFNGAKQRLATFLQPHERRLLARAMLSDTLTACSQARALDGMGVVTCDRQVAEVAEALGAEVLWEPQAGGQSQAVTFAVHTCMQRGIPALLTIPGDVPLITAADVEAVVVPPEPPVSVVLVPNRDDLGTNAMVLSPPDCLPLRFGYDSFQRHMRLVAEHHLTVLVRRLPRLALDIDEPEDLALFAAQQHACHSLRILADLGVLERLAKTRIPSTSEYAL